MNRTEYRQARRLIRDNGIAAETTIDGTERDDLCAIIQGICRKAITATTGGKA